MTTDFIIVGQGIAGTCLAQSLIQKGSRPLVIDVPVFSSSSRIAAGIMNPLVFKYLTLSWKVTQALPLAKIFYRKLEQLLEVDLVNEIKIAKLFSETEPDLWNRKASLAGIDQFIDGKVSYPFSAKEVNCPFGAGLVDQAAWVNTSLLIDEFRKYLIENTLLLEEAFEYKHLIINEDGILYKDISAQKIVFCEGYKAIENPYFDFIPYRPVKGEVLTVKINGFSTEFLLNKNIFLLPLGDDLFRVGATYDWDDLTETPTKNGKDILLKQLKAVVNLPIEIVSHEAGVRPAVADRRPVAGCHPVHNQVYILNGLGAKGVMLAPYVVNQLLAFLDGQKQIEPEIDVQRFLKWK